MNKTLQAQLVGALRIALRAPGIHTTDQKTGKVFSDIIKDALKAAKSTG